MEQHAPKSAVEKVVRPDMSSSQMLPMVNLPTPKQVAVEVKDVQSVAQSSKSNYLLAVNGEGLLAFAMVFVSRAKSVLQVIHGALERNRNKLCMVYTVSHQSQNCNDNVCPVGTFTKDTNHWGDQGLFHICTMQEKSLCCYPPDGVTLNSPFDADDLFPSPPTDGDLSWDIQDDPIDENVPNGGQGENNEAFGLIAMDGPSSLLSSLDISSHWVLTGCSNSPDLQVVTAFCLKLEDDPSSGCSAVFEAEAKNT
ncbi:hypothetical protein C8R46DRAFT_1214573 [Mycena filopes]|nr:hypothetical protein C8R46DRAFT_1214573 [Mycena filopes]